jgi:Cytochrome b(N-terminal)/b6/petB
MGVCASSGGMFNNYAVVQGADHIVGNTEKNVVGQPFWPYFLLKGQAWFFFIFGVIVVLATFAQINPIWLYGPV